MSIMSDDFRHKAEELNVQIDAFNRGPEDAEVALIGQAPGEREAREGIPMVGKSSQLMWRHLAKYGIDPTRVYTTNVVKRQLSLRDGGEIKPDELNRWVDLLRWELCQLPKLKTVFLMGAFALEAVAEVTGIAARRGSVFPVELPDGRTVTAVCALHPAYVLDTPKAEIMFALDCAKLNTVIKGTFKPYVIEKIINPSAKQALKFIADLRKQDKPVSFDIESINNETACYGLANDGHRAMCINLRDGRDNRFSVQDEADILLALQDLCESRNIVAQNGSFDAYWCRLRDLLRVPVWFDTLLAHHTLYPQMPHNLGFLTSQYTTHPYYKDDGMNWQEGDDIDSFWEYNCTDAAVTYEIHTKLLKELKEQGQDKFFFDHVMHAQPHLVSATVHGVAVDLSVKEKIKEMCKRDVDAKEAEFHRLVQELTGDPGYEPNPNSWPQLKELFFDKLRLRGRGTSTDATNRMHMMKHSGTSPLAKEMLVALDRFKEEHKFYSTYAEARVSEDGRMRCEYKQYGVSNAPGRLSSSQLLDGDGMNMQNQPVRARGMYTSDGSDTCLIYFDLGQAEARVVGWRAGIEKWMEQFEQARKDGVYDAHRALASEMFNKPYDQVPVKDWDEDGQPTIRYIAKRCRHGLNYRMERHRLAEVTELPYHVASRAFTVYHKVTPELVPWWEAEEKNFRATRTTYNALGRRFRVVQAIDEEVLSSVVAFYPQSTIGDKVTEVWYKSAEDDKWPNEARICIDVHDNLVAVVTHAKAKTALSVLKRHAETPLMIANVHTKKVTPLIIPAECKVSYPTIPEVDAKGLLKFVENKRGLHRWSHMKVVNL